MRIPIPFTGRVLELRTSGLARPASWLTEALTGGPSHAGVAVTPDTALGCTAVFACVRVLAESVASLPLHLYRRLPDGGKRRATEHPLYGLLHRLPNPDMTSLELREILMGHLALRGNAYAYLDRDGGGAVQAIWPLRPDHMSVERLPNGGLVYRYRMPTGEQLAWPDTAILHLRAYPSGDGLVGASPIQQARQAIGLSLAAEEFGSRFFAQGSRPGGVLEHPGRLSKEAHERLRDDWQNVHRGLSGAHRVAILEEGVKWHQVGLAPEDAQFIEVRRFQIAEIARIYRVPLHLLGEMERAASYASVEQFQLQFVVHTLLPWLVRWEQALYRDLIPAREQPYLFVEHLLAGLLRGDMDSRYRAYATGRQWGWLSADDVRELENMNPLPDGQGQSYLVPLNMAPATTLTPPPTVDDDDEDRRLPAARESRAAPAKAHGQAQRVQRPVEYEPQLLRAAARLTRWEVARLRELVARHLTPPAVDAPGFVVALERLVQDAETTGRLLGFLLPTLRRYAADIAADVEQELDGQLAVGWAEQHSAGFAAIVVRDHLADSLGQLQALAREPAPETAVPQRLEEWRERRPGKLAAWEAVAAAGVFTRLAMRDLGVTRLRWQADGPQPCAFCSSLHGRVVGIDAPFALGEVQAEGEVPMRLHRNPRTPPLHEGCVCHIEAERGELRGHPAPAERAMPVEDQKSPHPEKLALQELAIEHTPRRRLALDLFSGAGALKRLYRKHFERVIAVDKNPDYPGLDYVMPVIAWVEEHLEEYLDFDLAEFDDEGCPGVELQRFFAELRELGRRRSFTLCVTDGLGLRLQMFQEDVDLDKFYLAGRKSRPDDYYRFEELHLKGVQRIARRYGFRARELDHCRYTDTVVASAWRVSRPS